MSVPVPIILKYFQIEAMLPLIYYHQFLLLFSNQKDALKLYKNVYNNQLILEKAKFSSPYRYSKINILINNINSKYYAKKI